MNETSRSYERSELRRLLFRTLRKPLSKRSLPGFRGCPLGRGKEE